MTVRGLCTGGGDAATGTSQNCVFTLPGTAAVDDIFVGISSQNTGAATIDNLGGCTTLRGPDDSAAANLRSYLLKKKLDAGDISAGNITVHWTVANRTTGAGGVTVGGDFANVVASTVSKSTSANPNMASVSSASANNDIFGLVGIRVASGAPPTVTWPAAFTGGNQAKSNNSGINTSGAHCYLTTVGAAGSYGGSATTMTAATSNHYAVAIPPSAAFVDTATLSGTGALTTTQTPAIPTTATLSGTGALTTAQTPAVAVTAGFSGTGSLTTTQTPATATTATLSGTGSLTTAQTPATATTATLSGTGALSTTQAPATATTATLSGTGSLSAAAVPAVPGTATLSGTGAITYTADIPQSDVATLSGLGSLTVANIPALSTAATLAGTGALTALGVPRFTVGATIVGVGSLEGAAHVPVVFRPASEDVVTVLVPNPARAVLVPNLAAAVLAINPAGADLVDNIAAAALTPNLAGATL